MEKTIKINKMTSKLSIRIFSNDYVKIEIMGKLYHIQDAINALISQFQKSKSDLPPYDGFEDGKEER